MKKLLVLGACAMGLVSLSAKADITVKLPAGAAVDSVRYSCTSITKMATAKTRAELGTEQGKLPVKDNTVVIPIGDDKGGYGYNIIFGPRNYFNLYAMPGDEIVADVVSVSPVLDVNVSGSALVDQQNQVNAIYESYMKQISEMTKSGNRDQEKIKSVYDEYLAALKKFVNDNPTSPAVCFAVMSFNGEDFVNAYNNLGEEQKASPIYPLLTKQLASVEASLAEERKLQNMQSGNFDAPAFTLVDLDGKNVSLSDFKGKWVILDFWGSWCGWCIKGFPELKEIYAKHKDDVVIIGLDNGDTDEAWRAAVAKHELPWVNLYNPKDSNLTKNYAVSGFPTKVIVNPEGKIANITVGHTPDYTKTVEDTIAK